MGWENLVYGILLFIGSVICVYLSAWIKEKGLNEAMKITKRRLCRVALVFLFFLSLSPMGYHIWIQREKPIDLITALYIVEICFLCSSFFKVLIGNRYITRKEYDELHKLFERLLAVVEKDHKMITETTQSAQSDELDKK